MTAANYLEEVWRLYYRLRPSLFSNSFAAGFADTLEQQVRELHLPFDPVHEVQVLTDDLFQHGQYRFA